jgi:hypothetical protein
MKVLSQETIKLTKDKKNFRTIETHRKEKNAVKHAQAMPKSDFDSCNIGFNFFLFLFFFEIGSYYVAQTGLELSILLPQLLKY